ncbi:MAG: type II toxin-antitoxin system HipA family toxin YjjJ [Geobacteraceae bacterium]|nr:type II toxin-antitoxin system HipA family toxin YjjJ [Geobacteraceae bacterium]
MRSSQRETTLLEYLIDGPRTSEELRKQLGGISPATLTRMASRLEGKVLQLGKARATVYARLRGIRGAGNRFPVYRVDEQGDVRQIGELFSIWGGFYWMPSVPGEKSGRFTSLPWFIQDMRPEGFIGRAFAKRIALEMHLPERLQDWNDDDVLTVLSRYGHDCMGNLIVGEEALARYFNFARELPAPIAAGEVTIEYPRLAQAALEGDPAGSSAGGEQPKFTAVVERNGGIGNVLVKFSPVVTTAGGRRWSDLLVCEHLALDAVRAGGGDASKSNLIFADDRVFLEVERFDRVGRFGRAPIFSLGVVDDQYFGFRDNWTAMADRLESARMVAPDAAERLRWLWSFGEMIANTDMHFGNASLVLRDAAKPTFALAPAYDMLPMLYRPRDGEVLPREFTLPLVASASRWESARRQALMFWESAANDDRISAKFRQICSRNYELLRAVDAGPRLII